MHQTTDHIILVKPLNFYKNPETSVNNFFQKDISESLRSESLVESDVSTLARLEFDHFERMLSDAGVKTTIWESQLEDSPDAIFPNNWLVTDESKNIFLMPMFAKNRQAERDPLLLEFLRKNFAYGEIIDFTHFERAQKYFEGTGSAVCHHPSKTAFVALSERSDLKTAEYILDRMGYRGVYFHAWQKNENDYRPVYHTNVMLSVGTGFVVVCLESIRDDVQRVNLEQEISTLGLEVVSISFEQMENFCGNILQVHSQKSESLIVMSSRAKKAFNSEQLDVLERHGRILSCSLEVIETLGGGGARCMMAELF